MWWGDPSGEFSHDDSAEAETAGLTVLYEQTADRYAELRLELGLGGGLNPTLWDQLRNVLDARDQPVALLGLPMYLKVSRPARRLNWRQLATIASDVLTPPSLS